MLNKRKIDLNKGYMTKMGVYTPVFLFLSITQKIAMS